MFTRRTFGALLAGTAAAASGTSWGQAAKSKTVFYASVGPRLTLHDIDIDGATLTRRSTITLPSNIQYAWPHPSRRYFYVASSDGGPGVAGDNHFATAWRIDPNTGALEPHGAKVALPYRPIHISVDGAGEYALIAYNEPSHVTIYRINSDGTLGALVNQPAAPDVGIYAHQLRTTPSNQTAILVTRGNNAGRSGRAEGLRIQERSLDEARVGRAGQRSWLRPAPSRLSSDAAFRLRFARASE